MSEEIKVGKYLCKDGTSFEVTGISGDVVTLVDGDTMRFNRKEFGSLVQIQKAEHESDVTRTYTAADIERIVAIAARHQRAACEEEFVNAHPKWREEEIVTIQTAKAPKAADVLAEFEKMNGEKNAD